jgi:hypothetical protein
MEIIHYSKLALKATDRAACKSELADGRWSAGFKCVVCGSEKAYYIRTRDLFECANKKCKRQTSATAGTQFHGSRQVEKIWDGLRACVRTAHRISCRALMTVMDGGYKLARRASKIIAATMPETCSKDVDTSAMCSDDEPRAGNVVHELSSAKPPCLCFALMRIAISLKSEFVPP